MRIASDIIQPAVECSHFSDGSCAIVAKLLDREVAFIDPRACNQCILQNNPKDINKVTVSLAHNILHKENSVEAIKFREKYKDILQIGPPRLLVRAGNYAEALKRWAAKGFLTRSKEEIDRLFEKHCSVCDAYDPNRQICLDCGCRVAKHGLPVFNKLALATESCPRGYFKGVDMASIPEASYLLIPDRSISKIDELGESIKSKGWDFGNIVPIVYSTNSRVLKLRNNFVLASDQSFLRWFGWYNLCIALTNTSHSVICIIYNKFKIDIEFKDFYQLLSKEISEDWDAIILDSATYRCRDHSKNFMRAISVVEPNNLLIKVDYLFDLMKLNSAQISAPPFTVENVVNRNVFILKKRENEEANIRK